MKLKLIVKNKIIVKKMKVSLSMILKIRRRRKITVKIINPK